MLGSELKSEFNMSTLLRHDFPICLGGIIIRGEVSCINPYCQRNMNSTLTRKLSTAGRNHGNFIGCDLLSCSATSGLYSSECRFPCSSISHESYSVEQEMKMRITNAWTWIFGKTNSETHSLQLSLRKGSVLLLPELMQPGDVHSTSL